MLKVPTPAAKTKIITASTGQTKQPADIEYAHVKYSDVLNKGSVGWSMSPAAVFITYMLNTFFGAQSKNFLPVIA